MNPDFEPVQSGGMSPVLIKLAFIYAFFSQTFPRCLCYTKLWQDTGDSELHKAAPALQKLTPEGWWVWGEPQCSVVVAITGHWVYGGETTWSGCPGGHGQHPGGAPQAGMNMLKFQCSGRDKDKKQNKTPANAQGMGKFTHAGSRWGVSNNSDAKSSCPLLSPSLSFSVSVTISLSS